MVKSFRVIDVFDCGRKDMDIETAKAEGEGYSSVSNL